MRAIIYVRYSSDNQRESSIEDQVRVCRALIEREGWRYLIAYSDHAASGASSLRPGYQKLLEDARAEAFEVIVAEALDRLSRDQADVASLYKQLSFLGIRLVTLAEGEISELHVGLKGTMNALYLKDLADKTRRGLEGRVRQGRSGGGLCYGYAVAAETDPHGSPVHGGREIKPEEADVVRRIFQEFVAGRSPRQIAKGLNAEGIPGPGGRPWSDTTIRGHATRRTGILHNDLYVGRLIWNKQRYVKDPTTGKRLARVNPEHEWIVHDVPQLRILDQDLWDAAQDRLAEIRGSKGVQKARATQFWRKRRPRHLLTGKVVCGACGGSFASVGRDYLACGSARRMGTCGNRRGILRGQLEGLILDGLKHNLMRPDLVEAFISEFHAEVNRQRVQSERETARLRRELEQIGRRLDGLIEAIADGLRTSGTLSKLQELEGRKDELEARLEHVPGPLPRLHPNLAQLYRRKVEALHETLNDPDVRQEALEILRGLVDRIVMRPQGDGFEVELVGEIARMVEVALAEGTKKAALDPKAACSVKVVAGACNHRELTLSVQV